jgi:hypothetical protein
MKKLPQNYLFAPPQNSPDLFADTTKITQAGDDVPGCPDLQQNLQGFWEPVDNGKSMVLG